MAAGLADHAWSLEELVGLLEAKEAAVIGMRELMIGGIAGLVFALVFLVAGRIWLSGKSAE